MSRIDRYLLSQLLVVFGFFALVLILVYWINRAVILFDQLIGDGQSMATFFTFSALMLPGLIRIVLPIAAFAAATYVTNRLSSDSELTVMRATGLSAFRLSRPVLVFAALVFVLMSLLVHVLVPASMSELDRRQAEIAQSATARLLQDGQFLEPTPGVTFYIREITDSGELLDIFLSDNRSDRQSQIYSAQSAFLVSTERGPQLVMINGLIQSLDEEAGRLTTTSFDELSYDIAALIRAPNPDVRQARELPTAQLLRPSPALAEETGRSEARLRALAHDRIAQTLLPVVASLLGFATLLLGQFNRFGVWRQVVGAVLLAILVKGVESGAASVVAGRPELWALHYLPFLSGAVISALLLTLADRTARPRRLRAERPA